MATQIRIETNYQGIRELLNSDEVKAELGRRIEKVRAAAESKSGLKVTAGTYSGGSRARAYARYDDPDGGVHEANTGDLARALDEAGGA